MKVFQGIQLFPIAWSLSFVIAEHQCGVLHVESCIMLHFQKSVIEFIPSGINISFRPSIKTLNGMLLLIFSQQHLWKQNYVTKSNLDNLFKQNLII